MTSEIIIQVNSQDQTLSPIDKIKAHQGPGVLHRALTVSLQNQQGQILITQRSKKKPLWPLYWDLACSTHPHYPHETIIEASIRRLPFELGLDIKQVKNLQETHAYEYHAVYNQNWSENEINHLVVGNFSGKLNLNPDEIADYRWVKTLDYQEFAFAPWVKLTESKL